MLTGPGFTPGYISYFKGIFIEPLAANVPENRPPPPAHIQQPVDDIRVPR